LECIIKDREQLLAFYDFPAQHWIHIRTTNPIESTFATVRLRTNMTRNCGSRETTPCNGLQVTTKRSKALETHSGFRLLGDVITGVKFKDGISVEDQPDKIAA